MTKLSKIDGEDAPPRWLRECLQPGDTVYTILRHVSVSGMSRSIAVVGIVDSDIRDFTWQAALVTGYKFDDRRGGVKVRGCGMDMGFALVYELGAALFPDGFPCIGDGCPSNDHSNGDRDYTPGHAVHKDGGYALRHAWL